MRLEDFPHFQVFSFQNKVEAKKRKDDSVLPREPSSFSVSTHYHPFYESHSSKPKQMPQRAARAGQCSTTAPGKLVGTLRWAALHTAWHHSQKLARINSWEGNAPRKPTGLQEHHTFTKGPRFHNELLAPLKQLCLKVFSTACHH